MDRKKKLVKNTFILAFGTLLPKITLIITLPIYTAMLTKAEYGTFDIINILVSLFIPIITLQIKQAAFRFIIDYRENVCLIKKVVTTTYSFILASSLIALSVLFFVLQVVELKMRVFICFYMFLEILIDVTLQVVRGIGDNVGYAVCSVLRSVTNLVFVLILLLAFNWGLWGLFLSLNFSLMIGLLYLVLKDKIISLINFKNFDSTLLKQLLKYSIPVVPSAISLWVVQASDRLVVTAFMGIEANAIYSVANKVPNLLGTVYSTFNLSWQENAAEAFQDKDSENYYSFVFDNLFSFLTGVTAVLIAFTPILFFILINASYDAAYYQMPVLFLGVFFSCLTSYYGGIYVALKKTFPLAISSTIGAILNLIINVVFISYFGLYAASFSTLISYLAIAAYRMLNTKKWKRIQYNWKKIISCLIALSIMCLLCYQRRFFLNVINIIFGVLFAIFINHKLLKMIISKSLGIVKKFRS